LSTRQNKNWRFNELFPEQTILLQYAKIFYFFGI